MSKIVYVTRKERFNAAHKLWHEEWSAEKNIEVFGKCANPNWHGHNYNLFVTVKGEVTHATGYLIDLKELKVIIHEHVIEKLDHKNINLDVDFMKGILPSTENLAVAIWKQVEQPLNSLGCKLHCIKIQETGKNYVEYFGS